MGDAPSCDFGKCAASFCVTISSPWVEFVSEDTERDEHEALREGISDLVRLLRYERRAWSRRKRAVRAFMAIKLNLHGVPPP